MVKVQLNLKVQREIDWLEMTGSRGDEAEAAKKRGVDVENDGEGEGEAEDEDAPEGEAPSQENVDAVVASTRTKDIYGDIISKYVNIAQGGGAGGDYESSEDENPSKKKGKQQKELYYDDNDPLIDDSELQERFTRRVKFKHMVAQNGQGLSRYHIGELGAENEGEEDSEEDESDGDDSDDEEHDDDAFEDEAGTGAGAGGEGVKPKRKRTRKIKEVEGTVDPSTVPEVAEAMEKIKEEVKLVFVGENATRKQVPKSLHASLAGLFQLARRHSCRLDSVFSPLAEGTQLKPKTLLDRARKCFESQRQRNKEEEGLQQIAYNVTNCRENNIPLHTGPEFEPFISELLEATRGKCTGKRTGGSFRTELVATYKKILGLLKCMPSDGGDAAAEVVATQIRKVHQEQGGGASESTMLLLDDEMTKVARKKLMIEPLRDKYHREWMRKNQAPCPPELMWRPREYSKQRSSTAGDQVGVASINPSAIKPPPAPAPPVPPKPAEVLIGHGKNKDIAPFKGGTFDPIPEDDPFRPSVKQFVSGSGGGAAPAGAPPMPIHIGSSASGSGEGGS